MSVINGQCEITTTPSSTTVTTDLKLGKTEVLTIFYNNLNFLLISIYKNKTKSIAVSTDTKTTTPHRTTH